MRVEANTEELKAIVLGGAMAHISAAAIRDNHGNSWPGDRDVYLVIEHAQDYLYDQSPVKPPAKRSALKHAMEIVSAAKVQVVAEAWGATFQFDQAWSQSELQRLLDLS
jgi:hypothetical protein